MSFTVISESHSAVSPPGRTAWTSWAVIQVPRSGGAFTASEGCQWGSTQPWLYFTRSSSARRACYTA